VSSLLDEANRLVHVATPSGVDVVSIGDGSTAWTSTARPIWVGSLDGRTRVFALTSEGASVVELEPLRGSVLHRWEGSTTSRPSRARVQGGALVLDVARAELSPPSGVPTRAPPQPPAEPARWFVRLDGAEPMSLHHGPLEEGPETAPARAETRTEDGKLWLVPPNQEPPVLLLDPAPDPGHAMTAHVDAHGVVLLVDDPSTGSAAWVAIETSNGTRVTRVPRERCDTAPRRIDEVILCQRGTSNLHQEVVALDPVTFSVRWRHAALPLPMPSPYGRPGG